jgi:hypothetical protein
MAATLAPFNATAIFSRDGRGVSVRALEIVDGVAFPAAGHSAYGAGIPLDRQLWEADRAYLASPVTQVGRDC